MSDPDFGRLRPMHESDLARVLDWRNHPSIRGYMYTQHKITMSEHRAWWDGVKDNRKARFYIYERQNQQLGYVAFSDITPATGVATWGFYTAPGASKGTGSLLSLAAMDEAFGPLGLRKLSGEAIGRNSASIGLHESFGFQREGLFRNHVLIGGTFDDVIRLALFSDDWAALRPAKLRTLTERLLQ